MAFTVAAPLGGLSEQYIAGPMTVARHASRLLPAGLNTAFIGSRGAVAARRAPAGPNGIGRRAVRGLSSDGDAAAPVLQAGRPTPRVHSNQDRIR